MIFDRIPLISLGISPRISAIAPVVPTNHNMNATAETAVATPRDLIHVIDVITPRDLIHVIGATIAHIHVIDGLTHRALTRVMHAVAHSPVPPRTRPTGLALAAIKPPGHITQTASACDLRTTRLRRRSI